MSTCRKVLSGRGSARRFHGAISRRDHRQGVVRWAGPGEQSLVPGMQFRAYCMEGSGRGCRTWLVAFFLTATSLKFIPQEG